MHSRQMLRGGARPSAKSGGRVMAHRLQRRVVAENRATHVSHTRAVGQLRHTSHWLGKQPVTDAKFKLYKKRLAVRRINGLGEVAWSESIYSFNQVPSRPGAQQILGVPSAYGALSALKSATEIPLTLSHAFPSNC